MLGQLQPGDTLVADCYLCPYWIVAVCQAKGVNIVTAKPGSKTGGAKPEQNREQNRGHSHYCSARDLCKAVFCMVAVFFPENVGVQGAAG